MNDTPLPDDLNEELMTRWIDGHLSPVEMAAVERALAAEPALVREKESARKLGGLLRQHLPATMEPPSPEFFTSRIMEEIQGAPVMTATPSAPARGVVRAIPWFRQQWFAPFASAAAVALLFLATNGPRSVGNTSSVARAYAPDPNVVVCAFYSEAAGATVIDLKGLEAVPDDREIRAFDVADADAPTPGQPLVLHAANDPARAVLVLAPAASGKSRFRELN